MYKITIKNFPFNYSNDITTYVTSNEAKISNSQFQRFVLANSNTILSWYVRLAKLYSRDPSDIYTVLFQKLYLACASKKVLSTLSVNFSYIHPSDSLTMLAIRRYLEEGFAEYANSQTDSNYTTSPNHRSKNGTMYSEETCNTEERIVNISELSTILATTKLLEQGLNLEKEKERFKRYLKEYDDIIDKCISTENDNPSNTKSENSILKTVEDTYDSRYITPITPITPSEAIISLDDLSRNIFDSYAIQPNDEEDDI